MFNKENIKDKENQIGTLHLKGDTENVIKEVKSKEAVKKKRLKIENEKIFTIRETNKYYKKNLQSQNVSESNEIGKIEKRDDRKVFKSIKTNKNKIPQKYVVDVYQKNKFRNEDLPPKNFLFSRKNKILERIKIGKESNKAISLKAKEYFKIKLEKNKKLMGSISKNNLKEKSLDKTNKGILLKELSKEDLKDEREEIEKKEYKINSKYKNDIKGKKNMKKTKVYY